MQAVHKIKLPRLLCAWQGLRRAKVRDPVMLLDEIDKMTRDGARGDPSSALLEVGLSMRFQVCLSKGEGSGLGS